MPDWRYIPLEKVECVTDLHILVIDLTKRSFQVCVTYGRVFVDDGICQDSHAVRAAYRCVSCVQAQVCRHRSGVGDVLDATIDCSVKPGGRHAFQAANAQMISAELALDCGRKNIQIHGGMGFAAEINAHYFLKRAHVLGQIGGGMKALRGEVLTFEAA
jgi:hypothetical protein